MNFSTSPVEVWDEDQGDKPVEWAYPNKPTDDETYEPFAHTEGTPIFLKESSLQTKGQSALAYRAWWDITIDPGEAFFEMDFSTPLNENPVYRGAHKLDAGNAAINYNVPIRGAYSNFQSAVEQSFNKNKFKGINKIEVEIPPTSSPLPYQNSTKFFPESANLIIYFEQQQDPSKYTVDIEFKGANVATAQALSPNDQIVKITDGPNETNKNPNARDFVTNEMPLENCKIIHVKINVC